jgi:hypothetical protein
MFALDCGSSANRNDSVVKHVTFRTSKGASVGVPDRGRDLPALGVRSSVSIDADGTQVPQDIRARDARRVRLPGWNPAIAEDFVHA